MRGLSALFASAIQPEIRLEAVVVDDCSHDGTRDAMRSFDGRLRVLDGTGSLYWAGGMARAEAAALRRMPDYILWLNDDVVLDANALSRLLDEASREAGTCIVVGALRDPESGALTYSGIGRRGRHPLRVELVHPDDEHAVDVEMFNGNVVLVPRAIAEKVGPIDGRLGHGAADFDYGLRAARMGIRSILAPGTVGTCARGAERDPWLDRSLPLGRRLRLLFGPKGHPPRARARYLLRHGGPVWPVYWVAPYIRATLAMMRVRHVSDVRRASRRGQARRPRTSFEAAGVLCRGCRRRLREPGSRS